MQISSLCGGYGLDKNFAWPIHLKRLGFHSINIERFHITIQILAAPVKLECMIADLLE